MAKMTKAERQALLDAAEEKARSVAPARGPQRPMSKPWNPTENPVQVHAPKPTEEK
jgi:hypothetical protein